jgi:hypothetical protein
VHLQEHPQRVRLHGQRGKAITSQVSDRRSFSRILIPNHHPLPQFARQIPIITLPFSNGRKDQQPP